MRRSPGVSASARGYWPSSWPISLSCPMRCCFEQWTSSWRTARLQSVATEAWSFSERRRVIFDAALIRTNCQQAELVSAYAMRALPPSQVSALEAHVSWCPQCKRELEALRPVVDSFAFWPTDVLRPAASLQARLAERIAAE